MDLFEATEFAREYTPPVIYTVTEIKEKGNISNRELHEEMIDCPAYPLFLKVGERGWIMCKPSYDTKFHRVHTSTIQSCSSWGNGEDSVTIETMNTIYVLTKQ